MGQDERNQFLARRGRLNSLFGNTETIAFGGLGTVFALMLCYGTNSDPAFLFLASGMAIITMLRVFLAMQYKRCAQFNDPKERISPISLRRWGTLCISGGVSSTLLLGVWCFYVLHQNADHFIVLTAFTATLANMIGICGRNYPSSIYVNLQMIAIGVPMISGIWMFGDLMEQGLGLLLIAYILSTVSMAKSMRLTLDTALRRSRKIAASEAQLNTAMETIPSALTMFSASGKLIVANSEAREILSLTDSTNEFGTPLQAVLDQLCKMAENPKELEIQLSTLIKQRGEAFSFNSADGRSFLVATGRSSEGSIVLRIDDISEQKTAQSRIERLSQFDSLTGVANRSRFFERATQLCDGFDAFGLALAVVDVDNFKSMNDDYGHATGDAALQLIARRLSEHTDHQGVCARLGGDEFVVIQKVDTISAFTDWCKSISRATNDQVSFNNLQIDISTSTGIRFLGRDDLNSIKGKTSTIEAIDKALSQADFALYCAKREETEKLQIFDEAMKNKMTRTTMLREGMITAIQEGTLQTAFQVLVDKQTGRPKSAEALARWVHPELGPIGPDEFIPLAEQTGVIRDLTIWQLENACRCCASWPSHMSVAVNLSAKDFTSNSVLNSINTALNKAGLEPHRLIVEITETAMLELKADVLAAINAIRARGVRVALDDFGTGYSSLSYLHKIPFDILKIDRSFVEAVETDPRQLQVLSGITQLARLLEKSVVIEGIETQEMMDTLTGSVDFDLAQGYHFGRPMPERDIATLVSAFDGTSEVQPERLSA